MAALQAQPVPNNHNEAAAPSSDWMQPLPLRPIGLLHSCFSKRSGTPRQPLLVPSARAVLHLRWVFVSWLASRTCQGPAANPMLHRHDKHDIQDAKRYLSTSWELLHTVALRDVNQLPGASALTFKSLSSQALLQGLEFQQPTSQDSRKIVRLSPAFWNHHLLLLVCQRKTGPAFHMQPDNMFLLF